VLVGEDLVCGRRDWGIELLRLGESRGFLWLRSSSWSGVCHKFFEELGSVEVLVIHPGVVSVGITYPMHQILELLPSAKTPHVQDGFDFIFFLAFLDIRWWPRVRGSIGLCFLVGGEKIHVEYVVDLH
jgi:hypothetical protein